MAVKPPEGVFLDTNVYIDWADGNWPQLRKVLHDTDVYLCPSVVLEALDDYWTCHHARVARSKKVRN